MTSALFNTHGNYTLGIDVGGTFTDFVTVASDGSWELHKVPSTPSDPSIGVLAGLTDLATQRKLSLPTFLARVTRIVHGTTVATNALLTLAGARTGLVTTAGVRDALEMRRGIREERYNNKVTPPPVLVPRRLRLPVQGRLGPEGQELEPLNEDDVRTAANTLRAAGVESVAVCLMHSYINPDHEQRALKILRSELPGVYVTGSAEWLPQVGFYERVSSTVLNAYVGPILSRYLHRLVDQLQEFGFAGSLLIMQSNGGVTSWDTAARTAATTLLSGPAGGPVAGAQVSEPVGYQDCITIDMGGTSFEAALVRSGRPLVVNETQIARYAIGFPTVDIHTIGAGGGSIGWIDAGGLLRMGPQSAGAVPGPACYGHGGQLPTCTDANLVLGYLDPDFFLGGRIRLDIQAARSAIAAHLAGKLDMDLEAAAAGMFQVINTNMAEGVRAVTVRRGIDPRTMPLVAAGGAGPIHAGAIAAELQIPVFIVPRYSAAFCAAGMLFSNLRHDFVQTSCMLLSQADFAGLAAAAHQLQERSAALLDSEGVPRSAVDFIPALDMRYRGQHHAVTVNLAPDWLAGGDAAAIAERFHQAHDELYGYSVPAAEIELINLRLTAIGHTVKPVLQGEPWTGEDGEHARKGERSVWLPTMHCFAAVGVYDGTRLRCSNQITGPALVELPTTTILIPPTYHAVVDPRGSFVVATGQALEAIKNKLFAMAA